MVGYFSLVGLLRVHTLVGDYYGALKALGAIHPFQRSNLFTPKIASESGQLSEKDLDASGGSTSNTAVQLWFVTRSSSWILTHLYRCPAGYSSASFC